MNYDYAIHSDFLIHWTGQDIDSLHHPKWSQSDKSQTPQQVTPLYLKRLHNTLKYGLWMTMEAKDDYQLFANLKIEIPETPRTCFTELKVSESRKHARQYGRLGIGVKRPFLFQRFGRPLAYYGFKKDMEKDMFLRACASDLRDKKLLHFFKPMNSTALYNYDFYSESEWRVIYFEELLQEGLIVDPRDPKNVDEHNYFNSLVQGQKDKLQYLIPLDGWLAMIIYPSLMVKNAAQQDKSNGIFTEIERIKSLPDNANLVEGGNWPIEVHLDSCRNF